MKHTSSLFALTCLISTLSLGASTSCVMKQISGTRESGQSRMMDETFAGQNACDPEDHTRPFIIEWDGTDMSSFESLAANDIVIVKYEGCKLRVIDECRNDSIRGSQGAYKPPEWTSGSLETIDIHNEGELYAKLPLGKATLGGRVGGGERFHMEYFVAGTVYATRDAVYSDELDVNPGCEGATHFVYGYNLGAFALGSVNDFKAETGVSVYGFGGGASKSSGYSADKKGGDLSVCTSDEATEVMGCKTPIRLNLRKIRPGSDPAAEGLTQPASDASLNAAGAVTARLDISEDAKAHLNSALVKANAGDGKGCLAELDAHDELEPNHKSTDPKNTFASTRSQCVMLAGMCDAGKDFARKAIAANPRLALAPNQIDSAVEQQASTYCRGDSMNERDQLLQALNNLQQGALVTSKDVAFCDANYAAIRALLPKVSPKDDDDRRVINAEGSLFSLAPLCYQRAGDCAKARSIMPEVLPAKARTAYAKMSAAERDKAIDANFETVAPKCKGKGK